MGDSLSFVKLFNNLTIGEYFILGISFVFFGYIEILFSEPKVFNEIPVVYFLLILLEASVALLPLLISFLIYHQNKKNIEFFEFNQIGSSYNLFRGKEQITILPVILALIIIFNIIIRLILNNFFSSPYSHNGFPATYEPHMFILLTLLISNVVPYLLLLFYNIKVIKYKGLIDKKKLGFIVNTSIILTNVIIFGLLLIYYALFMTLTHLFYFYVLD